MAVNKEITKALEKEAQQRRERINIKVKKTLPSFIKSIEQTYVSYGLDSKLLPFAIVSPSRLVQLLDEKFQLKFRKPNLNVETLKYIGLDSSKIETEQLLKYLFAGDSPQIAFENGRYTTGPNSFVKINSLSFTDQYISVSVEGITDVAEIIIQDAFNTFWEAADSVKLWNSKEVQNNIQTVDFTTRTKVDLGFDAKNLLNSNLHKYYDENASDNLKLGSAMIPFSRYDNFEPSENTIANWTFGELIIQFHMFDKITGRSGSAKVTFETTMKTERSIGIVSVQSDLSYDRHIEMLEGLIKSIKTPANKGS